MASNSFGKLFRITTWGESHGPAIGVTIDGCPAGISITEEEINQQLSLRAPGRNAYTSPRAEPDRAEIYSGIFEGVTTGAPITIIIRNKDADSSKYEPIKHIMRPGHANFTYLAKYGVFDHRGGGRASARETACRVAAGAIAKKILHHHAILPMAYIKAIAGVEAEIDYESLTHEKIHQSQIFCPDAIATEQMIAKIEWARENKDSVGGIVELFVPRLPVGLGDPVYDKLEAIIASAMMSIPATKGFEIGAGFAAARMRGSEHNDEFANVEGEIRTLTNHAGGTLGGISSGMPLVARVAFKPTSSVMKRQQSVDVNGDSVAFEMPVGSRHDPCVAIRGVPVVEAMAALVLADALICSRAVSHYAVECPCER